MVVLLYKLYTSQNKQQKNKIPGGPIILKRAGALATDAGLSIEHHQDNSEVGLIDKVHAASKNGTK
jgi:hypothetical protein